MLHRHLLPNEIDLLLDGDVGFGLAPLKAHVAACAECRAQLDDARSLTDALDHLPRFAPNSRFAEQVMTQVHVFQPWHVAARDTLRRFVPASAPARAVAASVAIFVAALLTTLSVWVAARFDLAMFLSAVALERARGAIVGGVASTVASVFGEPALVALQASGASGIAVAIAVLLAMTAMAVLGLRALAAASNRRRG